MNAFELALKYYPVLWDEKRLQSLLEAGHLTQEQVSAIVGGENEQE